MSEFYHAIPLRENVYRITSVENVFCELLVGEEKAMLIDTGYGFGDLKGFVREITDKPLIIANTHGHVDHTSGNCQFEEQVYLSEADTGLCKRHNTPEMRRQSARLAEHTMDWATGKERYGLPEDFDRAVYERGGTGNLVTLTERMIFDLGGITIEAVATPDTRRVVCHSIIRKRTGCMSGMLQICSCGCLTGMPPTVRHTSQRWTRSLPFIHKKYLAAMPHSR